MGGSIFSVSSSGYELENLVSVTRVHRTLWYNTYSAIALYERYQRKDGIPDGIGGLGC